MNDENPKAAPPIHAAHASPVRAHGVQEHRIGAEDDREERIRLNVATMPSRGMSGSARTSANAV